MIVFLFYANADYYSIFLFLQLSFACVARFLLATTAVKMNSTLSSRLLANTG